MNAKFSLIFTAKLAGNMEEKTKSLLPNYFYETSNALEHRRAALHVNIVLLFRLTE